MIRLPGKRAHLRVLGSVHMAWRPSPKRSNGIVTPVFTYLRKAKGRYNGIRPMTLLKYGLLVQERPQCSRCGLFPMGYEDGRLKCANEHTWYHQAAIDPVVKNYGVTCNTSRAHLVLDGLTYTLCGLPYDSDLVPMTPHHQDFFRRSLGDVCLKCSQAYIKYSPSTRGGVGVADADTKIPKLITWRSE